MEQAQTGNMGRREFIGAAAAALFAGAAITLTGCSEDEPAGPAPQDGSVAGTIGSNHGHSVTITKAQIDAGAAVTLTLSGGHTHTVSLTAEQVALIKSGAGVHTGLNSSTTNGHSHDIMFM